MIVLYSGIPGSGKSYKMVHDLEEGKKSQFVIHNIDGLKEGYLAEGEGFDFLKYCEEQEMEIEAFFTKDYQIQLSEAIRAKYNKNTLIIIDECHEWFDRNKKALKMWLSYHRHLNQLVWLVAHRSNNLPSVYRSFIEVEYRAKFSSVFALPGYFIYNRILGGEAVGYTFARKKEQIFKLYKSMAEGFKKPKPSLLIPIMALVVIAGVWYFFSLPGKLQKTKNAQVATVTSEKVVSSSFKKQEFIYAGRVGADFLLQEVSSNRIFKIADLPGQFIVMKATDSEIILFDTEKLINVTFKRFAAYQVPENKSYMK